MSRTIKFAKAGGPEVLEFVEVQVPAPGPNEVRIKVKAIGINRAEAMWRVDDYIEPVKKFRQVPSNRDLWISHIRLSDKTSRLHPRHVVPKPAQAYELEMPVKVRERISPHRAQARSRLGEAGYGRIGGAHEGIPAVRGSRDNSVARLANLRRIANNFPRSCRRPRQNTPMH